jgi:hypothetical protein
MLGYNSARDNYLHVPTSSPATRNSLCCDGRLNSETTSVEADFGLSFSPLQKERSSMEKNQQILEVVKLGTIQLTQTISHVSTALRHRETKSAMKDVQSIGQSPCYDISISDTANGKVRQSVSVR